MSRLSVSAGPGDGKHASQPFQEVMSGMVCAGSGYTKDRTLVPKYYQRERGEITVSGMGKGGASLVGVFRLRGCGGIWGRGW